MTVENVGDFMGELETYEEWQSVSFGYRNGKPCLIIHNAFNINEISGYIFLTEYDEN